MVKYLSEAELLLKVKQIIDGDIYAPISNGHGQAGDLLEYLLGIEKNNLDVADAVGIEIKSMRGC